MTEEKKDGDAEAKPVDPAKKFKGMLKNLASENSPFEVRLKSLQSIADDLNADPRTPEESKAEVALVLEAYLQCDAAKGTDEQRGYLTALSPKVKSGQAYIDRVRQAVKGLLKVANPEKVKEPSAPKGPKAPENKCLCGCGALCHNRFRPGHDAVVKGTLIKISRAQLPMDAIPQPLKEDSGALRDCLIKWKIPTDANGDLLVTAPPPKPPKAESAAK